MKGTTVYLGIFFGLIVVSEAGNWDIYKNKISTTLELSPNELKTLSPVVNVLSAERIPNGLVKATVIMDKSIAASRNGQRLFRRGNSGNSSSKWIETAKKIKQEQERLQNRKIFLPGMNYSEFDFNTFHNLTEIYSFLQVVTMTFPEKTNLLMIGQSFEARKILALKIGNHSTAKEKKSILLHGAIHSREWITTATMLKLIDELLNNPENTDLLDDIDFYIIPVLNPDGYEYTWSTDRYWRKSRHIDPETGLDGVDLNRNFPTFWAPATNVTGPSSEVFPGFEPMSEIEIISLDRFIESLGKNLISYWDIHSYFQVIMYPIAAKCHVRGKHFKEHLKASSIFIHGVKEKNGAEFKQGTTCDLLYPASGTSFDHFYLERKVIYSFTVELFPKFDDTTNEFVVELDKIETATTDFISGFIPVARYLQVKIHSGFFDHI
ncbi:hypothetical protein FO519_006628 [Halicephalobus sp. NKZ332]|nr:hypothetical protein FO519_006628 [Halicephalobus sp. NKZ332]